MPSKEAWVQRLRSLVKSGGKCERFNFKESIGAGIESNIDNQSKSLLYIYLKHNV